MGEMAVIDRVKGDLKVIWNPENEAEVEAARTQFETLRGKGYLAYRVQRGGRRGEQVMRFNPDDEKIILAPPLVGG